MKVACQAPAQDLLSLAEMRSYLHSGGLPEDFRERAAVCADAETLMTSPQVHFRHASPHALTELLSYPELRDVAAGRAVPSGFRERVAAIAADDVCVNCDGRRCMGCVTREFDHACADDCPACCP